MKEEEEARLAELQSQWESELGGQVTEGRQLVQSLQDMRDQLRQQETTVRDKEHKVCGNKVFTVQHNIIIPRIIHGFSIYKKVENFVLKPRNFEKGGCKSRDFRSLDIVVNGNRKNGRNQPSRG